MTLPSPPDVTRQLAYFAADLDFADLPPAVIAHGKLAILDGLGVILQGATLPWSRMVADLAIADGGRGEATILGRGVKVPAAAATLANATAGHAFELDDIHRDSIVHPNSIVVPVAVNMAERAGGGDGRTALTAIVAGYEVANRIGAAASTDLLLRGFHPQGTAGAIAAAVTAGKMLGLDGAALLHAIGIAGSLGAGLMAAQEGAMVKRLHSGRAAEAGVRAALLAARGFTGIENLVEADYGGFLSSFAGGTHGLPRALDGLGATWETTNSGFKPHATVTSIHSCLDSLARIMADHGLTAADIARVDAGISHPTFVHCAWPYRAQSVTAAQMNLYYGLAMIALDGAAFTAQFDEARLTDPAVFDFIAKVHAAVDPEIDALGPSARHMAKLTVTTTDGRVLRHTERHRRGSPENPVSAADLV
ncbi:MAG: MmgE/PrpD family protein, partial [Pseudomonadota bacterium]|nr:MmgE/PrpD family protein [Pseudomonadota bacterium]